MSQINPFTNSILQTPQVQRQQSDDKDRLVRRAAERSKDSSLANDRFEHQVESTEELAPVHDDQPRERRFKKPTPHKPTPQPGEKDESHLDLEA